MYLATADNTSWIVQTLATSDISVVRKAALRDRLASIRKGFDAEVKAAETLATKKVRHCCIYSRASFPTNKAQAVDTLEAFFKENPDAHAYVAHIDEVQGNAKVQYHTLVIRECPMISRLFPII